MRRLWLCSLLIVCLSSTFAQDSPDPNAPLVRITTTLVQIDAIVTDKNGKPVVGLTKDDFQILQDGTPRTITNFGGYVVAPPLGAPRKPSPAKKGEPPPPVLTSVVPSKRENVHRTVAVIVDDAILNPETTSFAREALLKFLDRDIQDGDMVSITSTKRGMGIYSSFTTNHEVLKAAAEKIAWTPNITPSYQLLANGDLIALQSASIGVLIRSVQAMKGLPGRKSILLLGGFMPVSPEITSDLQKLADEATRAAVTIYTIDVRGLRALPPGGAGGAFFASQGGLALVADSTGGIFFDKENNIEEGMVNVMDDQSSYYLLGYNPGQGSFDLKYHKIEVKVLKPGLTVRSRKGYIGQDDTTPPPASGTMEHQTIRAMLSPFEATNIHTRLSAFFKTDQIGQYVVSDLSIDVNDLMFERDENGINRDEFQVAVANFSQEGTIADHKERGFRMTLTDEQLKVARQYGLSLTLSYLVKKPGPYQVRTAVIETKSDKIGTAWQFLDIPDWNKDRLALSGIMLTLPTSESNPYPLSNPNARIFRRGHPMAWEAQILHPKMKSGMSNLEWNLRVFRGETLVSQSDPSSVVTDPQQQPKKSKNVTAGGAVMLTNEMVPGEYTLQLVIKDRNNNSGMVTQAVDFRIIE